MKISKIPGRLRAAVEKWERVIFWVAGGIGLVLMFLATFDVTGRYFRHPIFATLEICQIALFTMVAITWAYSQAIEAHTAVDIVYLSLPQRTKNIVDVFNSLFGMAVAVIIIWASIWFAISMTIGGDISDLLRIRLGPIMFLGAFGGVFLFFQFIFEFKDAYQRLRRIKHGNST